MNNSDTELESIDASFDISMIKDIQPIKSYTHEHKKLLVKRITDIKNKRCYLKIFKIIYNDNYKYSQNDNGIFFNLTNVSDTVLNKIEQVIQYYENKKNIDLQIIKNTNNCNHNNYTEDSVNSDYY